MAVLTAPAFPSFNPGTVVSFTYRGEPREVTYETFKAAADKSWLLLGRDAKRGGQYRSFQVRLIKRLKVAK